MSRHTVSLWRDPVSTDEGRAPAMAPGPPRLADYEVLAEVGRGGMGVVYRARDRRVGRLVALKALGPEAAGSNDRLLRFENEARLIGALNHPNVCTLYDVRRESGLPCLVLEWVDGETLDAHAARVGVAAALAAVAQVARALAAAHAAGVVHRDVKPANVMVRADGLVKVLDFGLARLAEDDRASDSSREVIVGTVPYMSPEQATGAQAGPPSDVFSLGVVLHELITGARPFDRDGMLATLAAILSEPAPPAPGAGPHLEALLVRMLAKEPAARPSAVEVADALAVPSGSPRPSAESASPGSPRRWAWAAGALGAVVLAASAAGWLSRPPPPPTEAVPQRATPVVAVLPFTEHGEGSRSYFGEGVSEDLIAMLARAPDLVVLSRTATFPLVGASFDAVRREVGADYVLEGTVKKGDDKVRIVAQLVDARSGLEVWSERFDETSDDPWELQDQVTDAVVGALTGELGQIKRLEYRRAWGADSTTLGAYDYYLRGHERYMRLTPQDNEEAIRIWTEGLAAHPGSALLEVKLGFGVFMRVYLYFAGDAAVDYPRAAQLAHAALSHEHLSPLERRLGHWLQAYVSAQQGDHARAVREAETTMALAPFDAFQKGDLASVLILCGQTEQALDWIDEALASDPGNGPFYRQLRGWALSVAGRWAESQAELDRSIDLVAVPVLRAVNHAELGDPDAARAEVKRALAMEPRLTLARWSAANFYRDRAVLEGQLRDLAAAGLP